MSTARQNLTMVNAFGDNVIAVVKNMFRLDILAISSMFIGFGKLSLSDKLCLLQS